MRRERFKNVTNLMHPSVEWSQDLNNKALEVSNLLERRKFY